MVTSYERMTGDSEWVKNCIDFVVEGAVLGGKPKRTCKDVS